ncbi:MAG: sugar ABC transporter ATP-binding protein, partial [Oscillospiraceae bacterium]
QQKVVLAKWISTQPKILIVDEPTNGVDIGAKSEIYKILRNIAQQGASVIVVSSELPEILSVSDRILVMRKGRISAEFENVGVTQEMLMSKALKMK